MVKLTKSQQNVLNWAAKLTIEEGNLEVPREEILLQVGGSTGSFANLLTKLKNEALMKIYPKYVIVTKKGMDHADTNGITTNAPQSNKEQQTKLMDKYKLTGNERKLIEHLADGATQNREDVRLALGSKSKGSFANVLTKPRKYGLLEILEGKNLRLTDVMFLKKIGRPCDNNNNNNNNGN